MQNLTDKSYLIIPKLMKNSLDQISDPILLASIDGYFYYVNPAAIRSLGYSEEQILKKTVDDIFPNLKANDLQDLRHAQQITYQHKIITADNESKYFEVQASYDFIEEIEGISLILKPKPIWRELEKKHSDIQYQNELVELIINNIPEQIFWKDRNQVYLGCNRHFAEVVGLDEPSSIIGKTDYELKRDTTYASSYRAWDRHVIEQGEAILNLEEAYHNADGTQGTVLTSKVPLQDKSGHVIGLVGICTEITELKQIQAELFESNQLQAKFNEQLEAIVQSRTQELQQKNQQLIDLKLQLQKALDKEEEINQLKTHIITTISHEYRTPLSKILMATYLLKQYRKQLSYEKWNQYLEKIVTSAQYLNGIINNIVYLHNFLYQNKEIDFEQVDLVEIYQETVTNFKETNHKLKFNNNRDEILIKGNRNLLSHLIKNLLANAILYSEKEQPIMTQLLLQKDYIILEVTDQGIGIPPGEEEKIFDSFYRGSNVGIREGTGLGLATVKYISDLHEGKITVKSELGRGSTFTVYFPQQ